jgi:hypothetical protein
MYDSSVTVNAYSVTVNATSVESANSSVNSTDSFGNCANTSVDGAGSSVDSADSSVDSTNSSANSANSSANSANSFLLDPKPPACHNAFHTSMASGRARLQRILKVRTVNEAHTLKVSEAIAGRLVAWDRLISVTKLPACPQRGEDIHSKQAGLAQTGGFVTSRKLIARSCLTCVWLLPASKRLSQNQTNL